MTSANSVSSSVRNASDATALSGAQAVSLLIIIRNKFINMWVINTLFQLIYLISQTTDGVFVHVAVVYDGSSVSTYVDGVSVSVVAFEGKIKRVYHPMVIGTTVCGAPNFFQGELDTVSMNIFKFSYPIRLYIILTYV